MTRVSPIVRPVETRGAARAAAPQTFAKCDRLQIEANSEKSRNSKKIQNSSKILNICNYFLYY